MTQNNLKDKIMVVSLRLSRWGGRKVDRRATREVEIAHNAKRAGHFDKQLVDADEMNKIINMHHKIRAWHHTQTLPWGDAGERVLPAASYFEYITKFNEIKQEFDSLVDKFVSDYSKMKEASKQRLGTLYNESDYPSVEEIKSRTVITLSFMPLPDIDDFRIDLQKEELEDIKGGMKDELKRRVAEAVIDILERAEEAVSRIVERLDGDSPHRFKDSMITNLKDLVTLIPKLNFNDDPAITNLVTDLESICVAPHVLKHNHKERTATLKKAKVILSTIQGLK